MAETIDTNAFREIALAAAAVAGVTLVDVAARRGRGWDGVTVTTSFADASNDDRTALSEDLSDRIAAGIGAWAFADRLEIEDTRTGFRLMADFRPAAGR